MREILFKAKTESGRWIEGDLIHYESGEVAILEKFSKYGYEATEICRRTKVLPETVCKFTGLSDKNGKKIWENDIVCATWYSYVEPIEDITGRIIFDQGWCAYVICDESMKTKSELNGCGAYTHEFEVLGNVFDNPELMEG